MDSFKHVLAPVDFSSASTTALAYAGIVARASDAALTLLHVYPYFTSDSELRPYLPNVPEPDEEAKAAVFRNLARVSAPARSFVRSVHVAMREGDPSEEILAYAKSHDVDLIVMGSHGRHGLDRLISGSVSERVARDAGVSVLAIREPAPGERPSAPKLSKIACAVDLGSSSHETLETALTLARATGAALTVVHAIELWHWEDPWPIARGDEAECIQRLSATGHRQLRDFLAGHAVGDVPIALLVLVGRPRHDILAAVVQESADLLIVGAHPMSDINRMLFGSTAQHLLRALPCPVLIARPSMASSTVSDDTWFAVAPI
jgi:nucleotide-binding universal stress UspA family protein